MLETEAKSTPPMLRASAAVGSARKLNALPGSAGRVAQVEPHRLEDQQQIAEQNRRVGADALLGEDRRLSDQIRAAAQLLERHARA